METDTLNLPSNSIINPVTSSVSPTITSQKLNPDPEGVPRLLGNDLSEEISLFLGELDAYPYGLWMLGGDDTVKGSDEGEIIRLNDGNDVVYGGGGNDQLYGGKQNDLEYGDAGDDILKGDIGDDSLDGGIGNDILRGGKGNDLILGNEGKDVLIGDRDRDTLTGGSNSDIFVLNSSDATFDVNESDIITDFDWFRDGDKIALPNGLSAIDIDLKQMINFDQIGGINDTVIKLKSTGGILGIVLNVDAFDLDRELIAAEPTLLGV